MRCAEAGSDVVPYSVRLPPLQNATLTNEFNPSYGVVDDPDPERFHQCIAHRCVQLVVTVAPGESDAQGVGSRSTRTGSPTSGVAE